MDQLPHLLVAMVVVCGRLSDSRNTLGHRGVSDILSWSFTLLVGRRERWRLYDQFWNEIGTRLQQGDLSEGILVELGVLIGCRASM